MSILKYLFVCLVSLLIFNVAFVRTTQGSTPELMAVNGINVNNEPSQEQAAPFEKMAEGDDIGIKMEGNTRYVVDAKVESIKEYGDDLSFLIPYDALLAWGKMANEDVDSKLEWEQSHRHGQVSGSLNYLNVSSVYAINHVANSHLIPASEGVLCDIEKIEAGDYVHIEGLLVDLHIYSDDPDMNPFIASSRVRNDQGDGACEIIYVQAIRIVK